MQRLGSTEAFDGSHKSTKLFPVFYLTRKQMQRDCVCINVKISNQMSAVASRTSCASLHLSLQHTGSNGNGESRKCRID